MSDTALNKIIQYGTRANRIAFTPSPASGSQVLYLWYETDHAPDTWAWDGSAWQQINTAGSGTVTTTGSPASGNLSKFSGATSITNGDLSGDVATSGTLATTIQANAVTTSKINASAVTLAKIANASANSVLVGSGSAGSGSAYSEIALGTGLSMSGTTLSASGASGGLVLLEEHTASSSASLDFTTAITSAYDDYQIEIVNIIPATNHVEFVMRVSTDGGSTWQTSNYFWNYNYAGTAADSGTQGSESDTAAKIGTSINNTTSFGGTVGTVKLRSPLSTSFAKVYEMHMEQRSASASEYYSLNGGGGWNSTTAVNAVQFLMSSDNIASGTIRVYGLAK